MRTAVVVDDHELSRLLLVARLVGDGFSVIAATSGVGDGAAAVVEHEPTVTVADFRLQDGTALELLAALPEMLRSTVVVMSTHIDEVTQELVKAAGAGGYTLKNGPEARFIQVVNTVSDSRGAVRVFDATDGTG